MIEFDTRSNRFIATIGTGVALLLAVNLGILVNSHFLVPPYNASEVITYFLTFTGAIALALYKTIEALDDPHPRYIEGLVLGTSGSVAVLVYMPSMLFEPIITSFEGVFPFFAFSYLVSVALIAILVAGIVKGSELYCESQSDGKMITEEDEIEDDESDEETTDETEDPQESVEENTEDEDTNSTEEGDFEEK